VYCFYIWCPEQLHEKSVHRKVKRISSVGWSWCYVG